MMLLGSTLLHLALIATSILPYLSSVEAFLVPLLVTNGPQSLVFSFGHHISNRRRRNNHIIRPTLFSSIEEREECDEADQLVLLSVNQALQSRYACTRFQRYDSSGDGFGMGKKNDTEMMIASPSNQTTVQLALQALEEARRAPSGFNAQPYKLLLVSDPVQREAVSKWCCGHNAHRVRDSDCTVLFLADRQGIWESPSYRRMILFGGNNNRATSSTKKNSWTTYKLFKIQILVGLFSQGLPLPYWLSAPMGWMIRLGMRIISWMTRTRLPIPTLSNPDTWAQKNTMLVAMAYLLGCTARGIQTCPMEGYCAWGIRRVLKIPRRYSIPLIVATGTAYRRPTQTSSDDAGMAHGPNSMTLRYPNETIILLNSFKST